jgi:hypothetical protein
MHPFDAAMKEWLTWLRVEKGAAAATIGAYRRDLVDFGRDFDPMPPPEAITEPEVLRWLPRRAGDGISPRSQARGLVALRGFFRYQLDEGVLTTDPTARVELPKMGRPLPVTLGRRRGRGAAGGPGRRHETGRAQPGDGRGALCDGASGFGALWPATRAGAPRSRVRPRHGQRSKRAHRPARGRRPRVARAVSADGPCAGRQARRAHLHHAPRWGVDAPGVLQDPARTRRGGGHRSPHQPAQAPPRVRDPSPGARRGPPQPAIDAWVTPTSAPPKSIPILSRARLVQIHAEHHPRG